MNMFTPPQMLIYYFIGSILGVIAVVSIVNFYSNIHIGYGLSLDFRESDKRVIVVAITPDSSADRGEKKLVVPENSMTESRGRRNPLPSQKYKKIQLKKEILTFGNYSMIFSDKQAFYAWKNTVKKPRWHETIVIDFKGGPTITLKAGLVNGKPNKYFNPNSESLLIQEIKENEVRKSDTEEDPKYWKVFMIAESYYSNFDGLRV
jgi:hypothetical protein